MRPLYYVMHLFVVRHAICEKIDKRFI